MTIDLDVDEAGLLDGCGQGVNVAARAAEVDVSSRLGHAEALIGYVTQVEVIDRLVELDREVSGDHEVDGGVAKSDCAGRHFDGDVAGAQPTREAWSNHGKGLEDVRVDDERRSGDGFAFTTKTDRDHDCSVGS